ncbi:AAA family ATPase [Chryseobacterium kwangjuense]|uniref:DUF3696 domain-containing protein n=1 Tax=Chryseobacterium kwangjuense TaxID=267125 RepID=A0A135WJI0_9FLAO|nr:DUF3696 domain-containing protein [Chryseobacterium kwangjuense]KXH84932.1 hypothetical protein AU378_04025 [Chryseobacterium kwangjuense]
MISDLRLFQFKKFKDEHVELFPLTLLTGINGMGKSSVIQSLLILRQSFDKGALQTYNTLLIEDELVNLISPYEMLYADATTPAVGISIEDEDCGPAGWKVLAEGDVNNIPLIEIADSKIYKSALFSSTFQYLNAERIGPRPTYDKLTIKRPHSQIGYKGEFVANRILEALQNNEVVELKSLVQKGHSNKVYDLLSYWVSEIIYPGSKVTAHNKTTTAIELKYTFKDQTTKTFNPMNIGFGFSYALPVILSVLTAKENSILIVENPEAHLHPRGQSRMGQLLALAAESGVQIIIETHSDHLLNGIRVAVKQKQLAPNNTQIHFFTNEFTGTMKQSFQIQEGGELERWPQGFFDEWDNMLNKLLREI